MSCSISAIVTKVFLLHVIVTFFLATVRLVFLRLNQMVNINYYRSPKISSAAEIPSAVYRDAHSGSSNVKFYLNKSPNQTRTTPPIYSHFRKPRLPHSHTPQPHIYPRDKFVSVETWPRSEISIKNNNIFYSLTLPQTTLITRVVKPKFVKSRLN